MVKRVEAALLTCKPDVRSYILHLNDQQPPEQKFILSYKKENSEQLLVKRDKVNYIKTQVRDYFDTLQVNREDFE
mgnify:FL=1